MCRPTLARKGIQKKERTSRITGPELCSFRAITHILPFFSEPSFNRRLHPQRVWGTFTADWCSYTSTIVSSNNARGTHVHIRWFLSKPSLQCRLDTFRQLERRKESIHRCTHYPSAFEPTPSTDRGTRGRVRSKLEQVV
ncbi:hypothetical protein NPIL_479001 [Nephila pilipes]|uniref:Uncharacterized protein n=1 Tax=Nephila pilipes TaxID=299642 RepID=A0A8X6Q7A2_NEPPI|nr:hypothetical protein NPIL_479001 [Nephila pilipes]